MQQNSPGLIQRVLGRIEQAGNRLPHPTLIFLYLCGFVLLLSGLMDWLNVNAVHPVNQTVIGATSLLTADGLQQILSKAVTNFTGFAPVGTVLVAIMGIAVAEHSGLLGTVLKITVLRAPEKLMTFTVVIAGVLSSLAADTGYVVLVPLAALLFATAGRHPVAGIAAAFAGVSGGFSANLLIGPLDAILAGISTEAAALISPGYEVGAAGNYYFIVASTFLIALAGTWITERIVIPQLGDYSGTYTEASTSDAVQTVNAKEKSGLHAVSLFTLLYLLLLLAALVPENGMLRHPETGSILRSPFISGIVVIISVYAAIAGWIYGKVSGNFADPGAFIDAMDKGMAAMASYLVLMFFAAQFVNYFAWSQLGSIAAIKGAEFLQLINPDTGLLLVCFVLLSACINLLIGSASAKWALIAPIFVPMLLLSGISPEATQMAYRIGDSATNIITPLMPYFGVVVAFTQQYDKKAGIGTLIAMMLPYSVVFLILWSVLLLTWIAGGLPLGPGAEVFAQAP